MFIRDVIFAGGLGGFFYDDQAAIRAGAQLDGFRYLGSPVTPGFSAIRIPADTLGIGLVLSDGAVAWGDMMSVQYSAAGGREPLFRSETIEAFARKHVVPRLVGRDPSDFLAACRTAFAPVEGTRLPVAVEYGVSQALLQAAAAAGRCTMAEVICRCFGLPSPTKPVPIFAQSGDLRDLNVDKMVLKRVGVLPHGLINGRDKFGRGGSSFRDFVRWVAKRVRELGTADYRPVLHFDVYGLIGIEFGLDSEAIADFIAQLAQDAPGFTINIECPADFGSLDAQIEGYAAIVSALKAKGSTARIVVDERCNTLDEIKAFARARAAQFIQIKTPDVGSLADTAAAILVCKENGVGAYSGGSCVETDISARASVHVAVATQADMMLAKPGMGVDEGLSIVGNEQARLFAELDRSRTSTQ